ncbi:MAG: HlyD family efflux transporter periplasmic adaptor subunit [Myxococcota bacterium]
MDLKTRRKLGAATWGVGLVVALVWGALDGTGAEGVGYGFAPTVEVAALETGRISEVVVQLHQAVDSDAVVVKMDPAPLLEERDVASADLLAVQEDEQRQALTDARRFAEGMESTLVDRARISSDLQEDRALLTTLQERLSLEQDLASTGASSDQAVAEWERQIRVVQARLDANQHAVAVASQAANGARTRSEAVPAGNEWSVVAATRRLDQVEGRIQRLDLRAGIEGQVTWIHRSAGEVVPAGEPIVQIRPTATREVVAFLAPSEANGLAAGDRASVRRSTGEVVGGELVSVGAGPQPLPEPLWRSPGWPEYGIPVRLKLDDAVGPDEPVTVRL